MDSGFFIALAVLVSPLLLIGLALFGISSGIIGSAKGKRSQKPKQEKIGEPNEREQDAERVRLAELENQSSLFAGLACDADNMPLLERFESLADLESGYLTKAEWSAFLKKTQKLKKELKDIALADISVDDAHKKFLDMANAIQNRSFQKERNEKFKAAELSACDALLSDVGGKSLDPQQRDAVVTDELNNLVIAGAGSGKTVTVVGKVKYLVERLGVSPEDILVTSFTRASVNELRERIESAGVEGVSVKTFHKIGLDILGDVAVANERALAACIEQYLTKEISGHPEEESALVEFFGMLRVAEAERSAKEEATDRMATMKAMSLKTLKGYLQGVTSDHETWQGEIVHSVEELMIANYLFLNGVKYEYEMPYPYDIPSELSEEGHRAYQPDFYLPEYDIYYEHFGINSTGCPEWMKTEAEKQKYVDGMVWKRQVHEACGTRLIESYSYWNEDQDLLNKLHDLLISSGVTLENDQERNARICEQLLEDRLFANNIGKLLSTFISLVKANNETLDEVEERAREAYRGNGFMWHRFLLFITFARPIMEKYQAQLKARNEVDFDDMINMAAANVKKDGLGNDYRYIIIDEYQDISKSRLSLIQALREKSGAKLMCVGDDWQSIYRFAGSDVTLFTSFEKVVGDAETLRIERTYRNSQELVDIASSFILKNPNQLDKDMKALPSKSIGQPVSTIRSSDMRRAFIQAFTSLISEPNQGGEILILGRNNDDIDKLFPKDNPYPGVAVNHGMSVGKAATTVTISTNDYGAFELEYRTVHQAKGLEADNVIVIGLVNDAYGFPNMVVDDPVLELLLAACDNYPFAEERRLFYVALTRTRNKVWLIAPGNAGDEGASRFVEELFEGEYDVEDLVFTDEGNAAYCPKCGGTLLVKTNSQDGSKFVSCSNYPYCDVRYQDVRVLEDNVRCPVCGGYMVRRKNSHGHEFFGCSNYPNYCTYTQDIEGDDMPNSQSPLCPICGSEMRLRTGRYGQFYGCSQYPRCKGTLNIN